MIKVSLLKTGQFSTAFYLNKLQEMYRQNREVSEDLPIEILDTNFDLVNSFLPDGHTEITAILKPVFEKAAQAGVTHLLVPNITLHETLDQIIETIDLKLIHPIAIGIKNLQKLEAQTVSVLGTRHTMQRPYIRSHFENAGFQIMDLSQSQISVLDQLRLDVFAGKDRSESLEKILKLLSPSVDGLVLACTELSVAAQHTQVPNIVDLAVGQIEVAAELLKES